MFTSLFTLILSHSSHLTLLVLTASPPPLDPTNLLTDIFNWLEKYSEHEPDWADAYLSVMSGQQSDISVWTFDREFRTTWRRPDGSAIPLVV